MTQDDIKDLETMIARTEKAEADRKALIAKYNVIFTPEADAEIRRANDEKMVANALLDAAARKHLPALLEIAKAVL